MPTLGLSASNTLANDTRNTDPLNYGRRSPKERTDDARYGKGAWYTPFRLKHFADDRGS